MYHGIQQLLYKHFPCVIWLVSYRFCPVIFKVVHWEICSLPSLMQWLFYVWYVSLYVAPAVCNSDRCPRTVTNWDQLIICRWLSVDCNMRSCNKVYRIWVTPADYFRPTYGTLESIAYIDKSEMSCFCIIGSKYIRAWYMLKVVTNHTCVDHTDGLSCKYVKFVIYLFLYMEIIAWCKLLHLNIGAWLVNWRLPNIKTRITH